MLESLKTKRQSTPITQSTQVRLADSTTEGNYITGRLEVNVENVWGPVCFDCYVTKPRYSGRRRYCPTPISEAQAACWHMGYAGASDSHRISYNQNMGPVLIDNMNCYGKESVADCHIKLTSKDDTCSQVLELSCAKGNLKKCF